MPCRRLRPAGTCANRDKLSSLLLTYQTNWQTRYYVGARQTSGQNQIFAKISYAFSN